MLLLSQQIMNETCDVKCYIYIFVDFNERYDRKNQTYTFIQWKTQMRQGFSHREVDGEVRSPLSVVNSRNSKQNFPFPDSVTIESKLYEFRSPSSPRGPKS